MKLLMHQQQQQQQYWSSSPLIYLSSSQPTSPSKQKKQQKKKLRPRSLFRITTSTSTNPRRIHSSAPPLIYECCHGSNTNTNISVFDQPPPPTEENHRYNTVKRILQVSFYVVLCFVFFVAYISEFVANTKLHNVIQHFSLLQINLDKVEDQHQYLSRLHSLTNESDNNIIQTNNLYIRTRATTSSSSSTDDIDDDDDDALLLYDDLPGSTARKAPTLPTLDYDKITKELLQQRQKQTTT